MNQHSPSSNTSDDDDGVIKPSMLEVKFEYTPILAEILTHLNASLVITTYQAGKLMVLGVDDGQLKISFLDYDQPMGIAFRPDRIAVGTRRQIHFLAEAHQTVQPPREPHFHNGCFVPKTSAYTGSIHGHDLAWGHEGLWVVNTLFSCICTLHEEYSFVPRWRPRFISQLIDQDRCHLNGLAMEHGVPRFVTAMAESNEPAGWRPTKATSGVVMDIPSGETIARGFAMPHSPRVYQDRLWVLDSGRGSFGYVDQQSGNYQSVETVPGYTRGLAFHGQFAFVGLSRIRETSVFGGVPIAERRNELRCGIAVIDLLSGKTVAVFQFHSGVTEIFAVDVIPGISNPHIAGSSTSQQEHDVWIVPAPDSPIPTVQPRMPLFATSPSGVSEFGRHTSPRRSPSALADMAAKFHAEGRISEAVKLYEEAIQADPESAAHWVNLGNVRQDQGDQAEALRCYEKAYGLDAENVPALQNLGYLLFNMGFSEQAKGYLDRLLKLVPSAMNHLLAAAVLPIVYDSPQAIDQWRIQQRQILQDAVNANLTVDATTQLVPTGFFWAYQGKCDLEIMQLRNQIIRGKDNSTVAVKKRSNKKIKLGMMSAYFRDHTIGRLNIGRAEHLDRERFELTILFGTRQEDAMVERFKKAADQFVMLPRDVAGSLRTLEQLDLDVLLFADVGMDALCSTLAYSRSAPIQMTTWGHPETTGSSVMDYFVSSRLLESDGAAAAYSEKLILLSDLGTYYERPSRSSKPKSRAEFGIPADRHVYTCPQTLFKFHPEFDWALNEILRRDPKSELVILEGRVPEWTNRLTARWRNLSHLSGDRVRFLPAQSNADFLELLAISDVNLDPFHFGGGNSSYESLAVGTPIVTLPSDFLRGRITSALYKKMGFELLIARDRENYVELSVQLGTDPDFRRMCSQHIEKCSPTLFEDLSEVRSFENGIQQAVASH